MDLTSIIDAIADRVAERLAGKLGAPAVPERVRLDDDAAVRAAGAPSAHWIRERAREGKIAISGPRGGRYVDRAELVALVGASTIRREGKRKPEKLDARASARAAGLAIARGGK